MSEARDKVDEWVALGLVLQRGAPPSAALVELSHPCLDATLEILALCPPLGIVADLGRLLARAPFDIAESESVADPELREALDAYEEQVLGRLSADFRLESARDALLRLDPSLRPAAIAVFVEQILGRLRQAKRELEFDSPGPAAIRRILNTSSASLVELGLGLLDDEGAQDLVDTLAARYRELAAAARRCGSLIGDVELFTLENHSALSSPSLRLAMAQIVEAAQVIERSLPVRVRRSDESRGRTPTKIEDESAYPIGGYASISTVGGIESLVSSELVYMNPPDERASGEIDLFEVRWAAGELLKYTRDESVHTRERRTVCFALMPALDAARVKDTDVPFQRVVVCLGGLVAGIRKLCAWLDEAELSLELISVAAPPRPNLAAKHPLAPELALARLVLREYIESGVVSILEFDDADAVRAHANAAAEIGASDLVWLLGSAWQPSEPDTPTGPGLRRGPRYREHALSVAKAQPQLWLDGVALSEDPGLRDDGWEVWQRSFQLLLATLV